MPAYAATAPFTAVGSPTLPPLTKMSPGQYLESASGRYKFILETDGSLVIYDNGVAIWSAQEREPYLKYGKPAADRAGGNYFITQYYGMFNDVTRDRAWVTSNSTPDGKVTDAYLRTYMTLQDDGNLVLLDASTIWQGNSIAVSPSMEGVAIAPGTVLTQGESITVGANTLVLRDDGNLVFYGADSAVLWASHTQAASQAVMQGDGDFVVYDANQTVLWTSQTGGNPGAYGRLQMNGGFGIVRPKVVWARFGFTPTILPKAVFYPDNGPWKTYDHIVYTF